MGLLKGLTVLGMKKPMVLRMKGTKVEEAKKLIDESGFNMIFTEDLDEAAKKAVRMAAILRLAKEANINVNLTSWYNFIFIYTLSIAINCTVLKITLLF